MNFFGKVDSNTGVTKLRFDIYQRTVGGTETLLFSVLSDEINNTTDTLIQKQSGQIAYTVNATDKLVTKISATTNSAATRTVTYYV